MSTLGTYNNLFRVLSAEPDSTGRWSDANIATLVNSGTRAVALELNFPESTQSFTSQAGIQEYTMAENLKILRVYVAGQLIVPTDIPSLEGDQLQFYDQTGTGNAPQWLTQPNTSYPVTNTPTGYPVTGTLPFYPGMRPMFYIRGGNIGFVPQPAGAYVVKLDLIPVPPVLVNLTDLSIFPSIADETIVWKALELAYFSDSNIDKAQYALNNFEQGMKKLRAWTNDYKHQAPHTPMPITYRTYYQNTGADDRRSS